MRTRLQNTSHLIQAALNTARIERQLAGKDYRGSIAITRHNPLLKNFRKKLYVTQDRQKRRQGVVANTLNLLCGYEFTGGVGDECGGGPQGTRPHGGDGLGRGVGVGLVCAGITAVMLVAAINSSKQRITRNRECMNVRVGLVFIEARRQFAGKRCRTSTAIPSPYPLAQKFP